MMSTRVSAIRAAIVLPFSRDRQPFGVGRILTRKDDAAHTNKYLHIAMHNCFCDLYQGVVFRVLHGGNEFVLTRRFSG
jgi:hypothetical protein